MRATRRITVEERRARLAVRHRLSPRHRAADVVDAARRVVCLHATDPSTVFLSARARVDGMTVRRSRARALRRSIAGQAPRDAAHAVRLPARAAGRCAGRRQRARRRRRSAAGWPQFVETSGLQRDGERWLKTVSRAGAGGARGRPRADLRRAARRGAAARRLRGLRRRQDVGRHRSPVGPRVLTALSAAGAIVRGTNAGRLDDVAAALDGDAGVARRAARAALGSRGTAAHGRGVAARVRAGHRRRPEVVARLDADRGPPRPRRRPAPSRSISTDAPATSCPTTSTRWPPRSAPWVALLPPLDPTTMGWNERDWYLGPHKAPGVRPQRQRRADHLVRRPHRRRLAAARDRRGRGAAARGRRPRGDAGPSTPKRRGSPPGWAASASSRASRRRCAGRDGALVPLQASTCGAQSGTR